VTFTATRCDNARITIKPAYSPCAPELGWKDIAANPVMSLKSLSELIDQFMHNPLPDLQEQTGECLRTPAM
jgi:hypothetical protein